MITDLASNLLVSLLVFIFVHVLSGQDSISWYCQISEQVVHYYKVLGKL